MAVANILRPYGIPCYSGSGDIPCGAIQDAALRCIAAIDDGREPHILLIGDYDLDGRGNADRFYEDLSRHLEARGYDRDDVDWEWIAPLPAHLADPRFPDLRLAAGGPVAKGGKSLPFTMQAEALVRGGALRTILTEAVEALLDIDAMTATRGQWDDVESPALLGGLDALADELSA